MEPDRAPTAPLDPLLQRGFVLPLLEQLRRWQHLASGGERRLPLIALNGPVGAGKTTLGRQLEALAPQFGLRLRVASIDDLYLSWSERVERLAGNPFGVSRVPPGSHDLPLLLRELDRWRRTGILKLPRFDKTLAQGQGDRAGWREAPCDALVLEGWLMGCQPLPADLLAGVLQEVASAADGGPEQQTPARSLQPADAPATAGLDMAGGPALRSEEWRWLPRWNRELAHYQPLWQACDGLWLLRPLHWGLPRRWRFQAEARQRRSGGGWLAADELDRLVRASLCSLPPQLYQEPLTRNLPDFGCESAAERGSRCPMNADAGLAEPVRQPPVAGQNWGMVSGTTLPTHEAGGGRPSPDQADIQTEGPPIQAVAWLDGRRRCRRLWLQPSLSPSSSATG